MTGPCAEWTRRLPAFVLAFAASVAAAYVNAADLPPEIQADRYLVQAERQLHAGDHDAAVATLDKIVALQGEHGLAIPSAFWFKYAQASQNAGRFEQAVESATHYLMEAGQHGHYYMAALQILDASERELEAKRQHEAEERAHQERSEAAEERRRAEGAFADPLRSGGNGPDMVVIPAGEFRMGCRSLLECVHSEKPVHDVSILQPFAVSKYEITFEQWDRCTSAGGCNGHRAADEDWGRQNRPVVNVSWEDAQAYVSWLSKETGGDYRLPSESEWEYAARAGTTTRYFWGSDSGKNRANCNGYCRDQWKSTTAPVGSFAANAFGLYDLHGNVYEWTEDCWNDSYTGAPSEGSPWVKGDCANRVIRGGSWLSHPERATVSRRTNAPVFERANSIGFRVARTIDP